MQVNALAVTSGAEFEVLLDSATKREVVSGTILRFIKDISKEHFCTLVNVEWVLVDLEQFNKCIKNFKNCDLKDGKVTVIKILSEAAKSALHDYRDRLFEDCSIDSPLITGESSERLERACKEFIHKLIERHSWEHHSKEY